MMELAVLNKQMFNKVLQELLQDQLAWQELQTSIVVVYSIYYYIPWHILDLAQYDRRPRGKYHSSCYNILLLWDFVIFIIIDGGVMSNKPS